MSGIGQVISQYRKLGHKKFMKKFNQGVMKITPEQILKIQLISIGGQVGGLCFAAVWLLVLGVWYITIALGFAAVFSAMQFVETYQKYRNIKLFNEKILNLNELLKEGNKKNETKKN